MASARQAQKIEDAHVRTAGRIEISVEQEQIEALRGDPREPGRGVRGDAHFVTIGRQDVSKTFPSMEPLFDNKNPQGHYLVPQPLQSNPHAGRAGLGWRKSK